MIVFLLPFLTRVFYLFFSVLRHLIVRMTVEMPVSGEITAPRVSLILCPAVTLALNLVGALPPHLSHSLIFAFFSVDIKK